MTKRVKGLVGKWVSELVPGMTRSYDTGYNVGLRRCADELAEALAADRAEAGELPELPEPHARMVPGGGSFGDPNPVGPVSLVDIYTAVQLREYAIQAVRQAANAIFAEGWYLACDWLERDDLKFDVDSPTFAADRAARLAALLTLLENNSDR